MTSHNFGVKLVPLVTFHHQSLDCFLQNDVTNLWPPHRKPQEIKLLAESICNCLKPKKLTNSYYHTYENILHNSVHSSF